MKLKKILAVILSAAVLLLTSACGGNGRASKEETHIQYDKEQLKIAVIYNGNPADRSGYSYGHEIGIQGMQAALELRDDQIMRVKNVSDSDPIATEAAMRDCIDEGCNVIFGTSWGYMDVMFRLAEEYPDIIFSHGTGYRNNGRNLNNYFGRIYQARYLCGIVAGMKTRTDLIGYVAAMGIGNSEVTGGINAFAMGAHSVNPEAKVYVKVTNSWYDPAAETDASRQLIELGCDVIAQHCDTPNPLMEAEAAGVWGIGYNTDMHQDAPNAALTSAVWNWEAYYTSAVRSIIDGTWKCADYFGGMAEGLVDIAPLNMELCTEEMRQAVDNARALILGGGFNVFDGIIPCNDGSTVGVEGGTLDDATITGGIDWYFKTVEVK